ncbi:MAG TPA: response regulator [Chitinophagaceae bacterium]|jgi:DNA-binding response OmpR family regulator|nr:response regulator [Chitinophagaceae bacterium]
MGFSICIIEDDEGIQDVLKIILKRAGYETNIFSDGKAIFENNYTIPDLFLIDKQLAGADGLSICKHLKNDRDTKEIPVVMMSAYPNIRELSILAGANDFIEKPFKVETLLSTIREHIQNHVPKKIPA